MVLVGISLYTQGNLWLVIMILLGATVGVFMGVMYPTTLLTKVLLIALLILSAAMLIYGLFNHAKTHGKVIAISGFVAWSILGMLGLGTGT